MEKASLLIFVLMGYSPRQGECPNTTCECALAWESMQTVSTPPACVDVNSASIVFAGTPKNGCCVVGECNAKTCQFKVTMTVRSVDGQTCDFRMVPPFGDGSTVVCDDASECGFASNATQNLACGHGQTYQIKVNGALVWKRRVECANCEDS